MSAYVYILKCRTGHYYVGTTRGDLQQRVDEHNTGRYDGFTKSRRPVELVFAEHFPNVTDAIAAERQLKSWSRVKKEALIRGDFNMLKKMAKPPARRG